MKAVRIGRTGGPEVLELVDVPRPHPGPGQVLVRAHAIGVGMPDILVRTGLYQWMPPLPAIIGIEMSGTVEAVGDGVDPARVGEAVFVSARELPTRSNCYAEYICVDAAAPYRVPEGVDLDLAACLSNYQVAWHLLHSAPNGCPFDSVLIWAAAGGVGSAAIQLARGMGKQVIAVVRGTDKSDFALQQGAHACIDQRSQDVGEQLAELTGRRGVDLILDPIGGPDFHRNVAYLAPLGTVVNYGVLAGPPTSDYAQAMRDRFGDSLSVRFFSMHVFDQQPQRRRAAMDDLLQHLANGSIQPVVGQRLPLSQAREAHALFESGAVQGKLLLKP